MVEVDYQVASDIPADIFIPDEQLVTSWIEAVLAEINKDKEMQVSLCVVNKQEITALNAKYRNINKTTNVLSFPYEMMPGVELSLIGDVVVCAEVVNEEAQQQGKSLQQHWAHMVVHGTLHLLGYDHIDHADAEKMELLEINILSKLGFSNPYGEIITP
ncbi:rRNA maturation RNase YbeY [Kaarinaea lacus]